MHPEDRGRVAGEWERTLERREQAEIHYRLLRRDGRHRHVVTRAVPIMNPGGGVREWIGTVTDVHDQRLAREERERFLAREWKARAEAEERYRISRELHDRVAHSMAVAYQSLQLYEALKEREPKSAALRMKIAQYNTRDALDATRNLSMQLRQTEVAHGLSLALSNLLRTAAPPGLEAAVSVKGDESDIPPNLREQLFVILRGAIRNAVSHSGTGSVAVGVEVHSGEVIGTVEDTGSGFDPEKAYGNDIKSMRERTELLGGRFGLVSTPGDGAVIRVAVPLDKPLGAAEGEF